MSPKTGANVLAIAAALTFGFVTYAIARPAIENAYLQALYAAHASEPLSSVFARSFAWACLLALGVCVGSLTVMTTAIEIIQRRSRR